MNYNYHSSEIEHTKQVEISKKPNTDHYRHLAKSTLDLVRLREQLTASHVDSVTGLPNRYTFDQRYNRLFWRAKQDKTTHLGLLIGDLDYLKEVNDNYGHPAGDEYLRRVSQSIQFALRPQDQVYRVGGDEFAALLTGIKAEDGKLPDLSGILERARASVDEAVGMLDLPKELNLGMSLGLDIVRVEDGNPIETINRVDQLMYQDKRLRRLSN